MKLANGFLAQCSVFCIVNTRLTHVENVMPLSGNAPVVGTPIGRSDGGSQPLARRRILVVDDTRAAAFLLGRLLESLGQDVRVCYDAESALRLAAQQIPDIIFSDIVMPETNGYELAQRVRAEQLLRSVTLVALTGYDQESDKRLAHAAGFDHHLVKPVSIQALRTLLESHIV